jgi:hypothetical protein
MIRGIFNMKKVLFLIEKDKKAFLNEINESLKIKNRLIKLIITNPDKKVSLTISRRIQFKYEEQILLLERIRSMVISCTTREQLGIINKMIARYNSID